MRYTSDICQYPGAFECPYYPMLFRDANGLLVTERTVLVDTDTGEIIYQKRNEFGDSYMKDGEFVLLTGKYAPPLIAISQEESSKELIRLQTKEKDLRGNRATEIIKEEPTPIETMGKPRMQDVNVQNSAGLPVTPKPQIEMAEQYNLKLRRYLVLQGFSFNPSDVPEGKVPLDQQYALNRIREVYAAVEAEVRKYLEVNNLTFDGEFIYNSNNVKVGDKHFIQHLVQHFKDLYS